MQILRCHELEIEEKLSVQIFSHFDKESQGDDYALICWYKNVQNFSAMKGRVEHVVIIY